MRPPLSGLDRLRPDDLPGRRVALLSHYAAVDAGYRTALDVLVSMPGVEVASVMGPQHGFWGETQDNMIEWESTTHPRYGIPLHSLYGASREPGPEAFLGCDCVVVDLQDAGSRYYTYVYAMALTMRRAAEAGLPVVVLDRFNPAGLEIVEGVPQDPGFLSYVGMYPLPARHAMTTGELARLFAALDGLPAPVVVKAEMPCTTGYPPGRPWVHPSPNLPTPATALVYPGICLLEGTNLSEGRGTCRPFEIFGAPWLDEVGLCESLNGTVFMEGARLSPHRFVPTFGKHAGETCRGAILSVTDPEAFRPLRSGFGILLRAFGREGSRWRDPPYEYVWDRMPIDILTGSPAARQAVEAGDEPALLALALGDPGAHARLAGPHLLYERKFRS